MRGDWPEEAAALIAALGETPLGGVRANTLKIEPERLPELLGMVLERASSCPEAFVLPEGTKLGRHALHAAGVFYLQDTSAMAAISALDPQPGEIVLDLCAAPGGKSTGIAARMRGKGVLLSNDPHPARARVLLHNLERFGATNAVVTQEEPSKIAASLPCAFDRVLVDAPCSGEGMFAKEPESRLEWTPDSPRRCAGRQADILNAAAALVRDGGVLVYSTCTFNREENEETIEAFVNRHRDFEAESVRRLWPQKGEGAGHFIARLKKGGAGTAAAPVKAPNAAAAQMWGAFECELLSTEDGFAPILRDNWLYSPTGLNVRGLRVLRDGLQLARVSRDRLEPAHALAMAIAHGQAKRALDLSEAEAYAYLRGEALPRGEDARGWAIAAHKGFALGWGRLADGRLQNTLPKGIRMT